MSKYLRSMGFAATSECLLPEGCTNDVTKYSKEQIYTMLDNTNTNLQPEEELNTDVPDTQIKTLVSIVPNTSSSKLLKGGVIAGALLLASKFL